MKQSFYELTYSELQSLLEQHHIPPRWASQIFNWHYKHKRTDFYQGLMPQKYALQFNELVDFDLPKIATVHESTDQTVKFLFELEDGNKVESVLIPFINKYSLCLSTQAGCAMKCSFCFTGTQGLKRNLSTKEIVGQLIQVWNWKRENRPEDPNDIKSLVYMGQGEPLHNFEAVKKSCQIFLTKEGACFGPKRITVSTAGYLPGLSRWKDEMPGVNLALSFHAADNEKRNKLIPINAKYPIDSVLEEMAKIPLLKKQFLNFEYLLIKDFNDSVEDAELAASRIAPLRAIVNLIPFNPFPGSPYKRPTLETVVRFQRTLERFRIPTMIRGTKGGDILAACGQLNSKYTSGELSL